MQETQNMMDGRQHPDDQLVPIRVHCQVAWDVEFRASSTPGGCLRQMERTIREVGFCAGGVMITKEHHPMK